MKGAVGCGRLNEESKSRMSVEGYGVVAASRMESSGGGVALLNAYQG